VVTSITSHVRYPQQRSAEPKPLRWKPICDRRLNSGGFCKVSVRLFEQKTSIAMEPEVLQVLLEVAEREETTPQHVIEHICTREALPKNRSRAIRIWCLQYYRDPLLAKHLHAALYPYDG
jgi:predicted DNA-binding ribbon-helix-helix protein